MEAQFIHFQILVRNFSYLYISDNVLGSRLCSIWPSICSIVRRNVSRLQRCCMQVTHPRANPGMPGQPDIHCTHLILQPPPCTASFTQKVKQPFTIKMYTCLANLSLVPTFQDSEPEFHPNPTERRKQGRITSLQPEWLNMRLYFILFHVTSEQ